MKPHLAPVNKINRALVTVGVSLAVLAGCVLPPSHAGWDRWVRTHETVLIVTDRDQAITKRLNGAGGGYDPNLRIAAVNVDTIIRAGATPDQLAFRIRHEEAHAWILDTGYWQQMPAPGYLARQEQAAQCIARALTGTIPVHLAGETDALGYWSCPEPYLSHTAGTLRMEGLL